MLNPIFAALLLGAVLVGAYSGTMPAVSQATLDGAKGAASLALGLIGQMALWLGFMGVLERAGMMSALARAVRPVMVRLFPGVPADHPAMAAMVLNVVANVLGLGNAATPFGIKAMVELDRLNPRPGVATDAMALFLAINTSGVAVLPLGVLAARAQLGAVDVAGIVLPSVLATFGSTLVAIAAAKLLAKRRIFAAERSPEAPRKEALPIPGLEAAEAQAAEVRPSSPTRAALAGAVGLALVVALALELARVGSADPFGAVKEIASGWLLPMLVATIVLLGLARGVPVYDAFLEGAKSGFRLAVGLIPYLVGILVAVAMFRASGALDRLLGLLAPITGLIGFPPELLPMALVRPLSGSGAYGVMVETMQTHGPDSLIGFAVSVMNGSTETTFYVLAVYFGAVGVKAVRHTVIACLMADVTGAVLAFAFSLAFHR